MNFFKIFLASVTGTIIGVTLLILILFITIISTSGEPEPYIRANTVLEIEISGDIPARTLHDPFKKLFSPEAGDRVSLEFLKNNLEKAASDERISGIWLKLNRITTSWANLETAYHYIQEFKENSDKFIYTSTDDLGMNESAYFLATLSDSIFSPPETFFEFNGFVIQTSYYKNMLEMIGIEPEIMRVGSYKSAVEPFLQEESSPENREQLMAILRNTSDTFISAVGANREVDAERINSLMNEIPANNIEWALESGLIDVIAHPHEVENAIRQRLGIEEDSRLRTVSLARYHRIGRSSAGIEEPATGNRIAIIYADGMIIPENVGNPIGSDAVITAKSIQKSLESSLNDDDVKAIVIHINSGGGAVSTSELIYGHIREAATQKPVIAYMGNVAASGGYYIAMGADSVMASANTITGSIGIYNLMFNSQEFFNEKLGINFEEFKTHNHADINLMNRPLTENEREAIQRSVENGYETFLDRVSEGRGMTRDEVHEIAQGRVWTGSQAKDIHLVDQLGSLEDALNVAADKAGIAEYRTVTYPERKELFELLFSSAEAKVNGWSRSMIPYSNEVETVEQLIDYHAGRNWAILPVRFTID